MTESWSFSVLYTVLMHGLSTHTEDDIVTCTIELVVRSADELTYAMNSIRAIDGVEETLSR